MAPEAHREQEQSIKARKREIFEEEHHAEGPRRPFSTYVAATPAAPMSAGVKATLGAVAALVVLLLLAALLTVPGPKVHRRGGAGAAAPASGGR